MKYWRHSKASEESIEQRRIVHYTEDEHVATPHEDVSWNKSVL